MEKKAKRWIVVAVFFAAWFLAADAYWMSKDRTVSNCVLHNAAELFKNGRTSLLIEGKEVYWEECSWVMGAGNYWNSPKGMAYWEMIFLSPVIYRYRFDL